MNTDKVQLSTFQAVTDGHLRQVKRYLSDERNSTPPDVTDNQELNNPTSPEGESLERLHEKPAYFPVTTQFSPVPSGDGWKGEEGPLSRRYPYITSLSDEASPLRSELCCFVGSCL